MNRGGVLGLFFAQVFGMMANWRWRIKPLVHRCYKDSKRHKKVDHEPATHQYVILFLSYGWGVVPRYVVWALRKLGLIEQRYLRFMLEDGTPVYVGDPLFVVEKPLIHHEDWVLLENSILKAARYSLRAWADIAGDRIFEGFNGCSLADLETPSNTPFGWSGSPMNEFRTGSEDLVAAPSEGTA